VFDEAGFTDQVRTVRT